MEVQNIRIDLISPSPLNPRKTFDEAALQELASNIEKQGLLQPITVRVAKSEDVTDLETGDVTTIPCSYEIVCGERRFRAVSLLKEKEDKENVAKIKAHRKKSEQFQTISCIVREMTDDEAVIAMVDANIQREELLPSEKAFAFKMKMEAVRRQGNRSDLTSDQNGPKLSAWAIGEDSGISGTQVKRYIRLTELIPELLEYLDLKRIPFTSAVEISYLDQEIQKWLFEYIRDNGLVKPKQIALLREACKTGIMTEGKLIAILNDSQPGRTPSTKNLISEKKLRKYFPTDYTEEDMRSVIVELLEQWSQGKESE